MNTIWTKIILFALLLTLVLEPFAGFAPLLLIILIAGTVWFLASMFQILVLGNSDRHKNTANN